MFLLLIKKKEEVEGQHQKTVGSNDIMNVFRRRNKCSPLIDPPEAIITASTMSQCVQNGAGEKYAKVPIFFFRFLFSFNWNDNKKKKKKKKEEAA